MLAEAVRSGLRIHAVFVAQGCEHLVEGLDLGLETELLALPAKLLVSALATDTPQPVAALIEPPSWNWVHLLGGASSAAPLVVVLAGIQDPGNLGTILRSAEAFAASGVVSLPGTVGVWNPKAVRASAGSVFRMPLVTSSAEECLSRLGQAGIRVLSTTTREDSQPAGMANLAAPVALLIGNEGNGVPREIASQADGAVTISCPGPVESLNAAVAASVLLYEASRQRLAEDESKHLHGAHQ